MKLLNRLTLWFSLLLIAVGSYAPAVSASTLANDPFIREAIARENFEPGGKYHLFGSARGTIGDRTGEVGYSSIYHQHLGNLEMEKIALEGTIEYKTHFSNHGHEEHAPFSSSREDSAMEERGNVTDSFTLYTLNWRGRETHPADAYDGPQGGDYPEPTGARDEYTYNISGIAQRIKLNPQIVTSDDRSFSERWSDSWDNAHKRGSEARQKITAHNPRLDNLGNAFEAGNGLYNGFIYNPIGFVSDVTGVSSAIQSGMQAAQHSVERGIMRYVASKSTEEKFGAIDRVASWGAAIDWTAEQFQDFVNEYPNLAEGIEFALNTAVVKSGAAAAASVAKNAPKYGKTIKEFAKSERGSVRVTKSGRSSSKSSGKKSGSDNDGTVKNTGKAASASAAKSVKTGSSSGQTGNSEGGSANASNSGTRGSTSSSGTTSSSSSSGGSRGYGSSLGSGIGGSYAVGKMEAVGTPTAVKTARPTPRQSEIDVGNTLPNNAKAQVSYKDGKEAKYGEKGSVRPDWCVGSACSIEVKNYDIHRNRDGLVNNIAKQAQQRQEHLPKNMEQRVQIDLRGQTYTDKDMADIASKIENKTKGIIKSKNIIFITK